MLSGVDDKLAPVKQTIANNFLPDLFNLPKEEVAPFCHLLGPPTKFFDTWVLGPTTTGPDRHETLVDAMRVLVNSLFLDREEFDVKLYTTEGQEAKKLQWEICAAAWSADMEVVLAGFSRFEHCCLNQSTEFGVRLTMLPLAVHGTTLKVEEFCDNFCLRYGITTAITCPPVATEAASALMWLTPCCASREDKSLPGMTPSRTSGRPSAVTPLAT